VLRSFVLLASIAAWLAAAGLAVSPALVGADTGGVLPWTRWAMALLTAVALALALPEILHRQQISWRSSSVTLATLLFALIGLVQCWAMPDAIGKSIASGSWEIYESTQRIISLSSGSDLNDIRVTPSISLSRWLTLNATAFMAVLAVVAFVSSQLFATRSRVSFLLICLALTGAIHAALGVYQITQYPNANVWGIVNIYGGQPFGAFFNRNNAGAILNMGLAASVGLVAWRLAAITGAAMSLGETSLAVYEWFDVLFDRVAMIGVICSIVTLGGLFACGSRGAIAGSIVGFLLALGILQSIHRGRGIVPALLAIAVIAGILLLKFEVPTRSLDRLSEAKETIENDGSILTSRMEHWKDGWRAAMVQPMLGWGLRSYRYAYLPYQQTSAGSWYVNADNLWLEWFLEMGFVGMAIAIALLLVIVQSLFKLNASTDPIDHGLATSGWFTLGSIGMSQAFDFGCIIPANSIMLVIIASTIVGRAAAVAYTPAPSRSLPSKAGTIGLARFLRGSEKALKPNFLALVAISAVICLALVPAIQRLEAESHNDHLRRNARQLFASSPIDEAGAVDLKRAMESNLALRAIDPLLLLDQSRVIVDLARAQAGKQAAGVRSPIAPPETWVANYEALSPNVLRAIWYAQAPTETEESPASIAPAATTNGADAANQRSPAGNELIRESLLPFEGQPARAVRNDTPPDKAKSIDKDELALGTQFHRARLLALQALAESPNDDQVIRNVVQLDFVGGSPSQSEALIASLIKLRSQRGKSLYSAGKLAFESHFWDLASSAWTRAMDLEPELTWKVIRDISGDNSRPVLTIFPDNPKVLAIVANQELSKADPNAALLDRTIQIIQRNLSIDPQAQTEDLKLLARIFEKRRQPALAAKHLGKAVQLVPKDSDLRYFYTVMLRASGNLVEAKKQVRMGRRLAPDDRRFEELSSEILEAPP
jgi:O-antigen ligase